jgi:LPS sulfotransferase NodH
VLIGIEALATYIVCSSERSGSAVVVVADRYAGLALFCVLVEV